MQNHLDKFLDYQKEIKKKSDNTIVSFKRDLSKMIDFFSENGIVDARKINETQINSYMLFLERSGLSTATISRYLSSIRAFFNFLIRERVINTDPSEKIKAPKIIRTKPDILTVEQVDILLAQPHVGSNIGLRDKAILELLYASGMKASELIRLKINDVDISMEYISCSGDGNERRIPLGRPAAAALNEYIKKARINFLTGQTMTAEDDAHKFLFLNYTGTPISRQGLWKMIKKYGERAGIEVEITPQMLRHSFAAHMIQNGADLKTIQEILGHSDVSVTEMYSVFCDNKIRAVYKETHPRYL